MYSQDQIIRMVIFGPTAIIYGLLSISRFKQMKENRKLRAETVRLLALAREQREKYKK